MNPLFLDIGNSSFKVAVKEKHNGWNLLLRGFHHEFSKLQKVVNDYKDFSPLVYSSVRNDVSKKLQTVFQHKKLYRIHSGLIPTIYLHYDTPASLGSDRFLACYGAVKGAHAAKSNSAVVIDAGTACTIDYMSAQGVFHGGVIMSGISVLKKAAQELLPELPAAIDSQINKFPGKSTLECVNIGLYHGFAAALQEFTHRFLLSDPDARIFVTGGDSEMVCRLIGDKISLERNEFLVFEGMEAFVATFGHDNG